MREDGPDDRPPGTPGTGPPSVRARADLRRELQQEVTDARLRFQEAGMRAEAHRLLGDDHAVAAVLEEQQQVLTDLERRLGRVVSAAVLQRDAEEVVAGSPALGAPPRPARPDPPPPRRRPALQAVASAAVVVAVAALATLGITDAPSRLDVRGAADRADQPTAPATTPTDPPSQRPLAADAEPAPDPTGRAPHGSSAAPSDAEPEGVTPTTPRTPAASQPEEEPTDLPTDAGLDELVAGLTDALRQLGAGADDGDPQQPDGPTDAGSDLDERVGEAVEDVVDELDGREDPASDASPDPDDGFVSGGTAQ